MELKKELLEFLEANNNFGLIEGLVEGIVDTYISVYKKSEKSLSDKKVSQHSAVEFFAEKVGHNSLISLVEYNELFEQAKEMDKEQKIQFANEYSHAVMGGCLLTPTEFYNETFKLQ